MARKASKYSVVSGSTKPDFSKIKKDNSQFKREFEKAMYYAHYELSDKRLRAETTKYFKLNKLDTTCVDNVDSPYYVILGKVCYILNNGGEVSEQYETFVKTQVEKIIVDGTANKKQKKAETEVKEVAPVVNIQDRLREQAAKTSEQFDVHIDTFIECPSKFDPEAINPHALMLKDELKAGQARWILKFYENEIAELDAAIEGHDPDLKEGYAYTKTQMKRLQKFYAAITTGASMIIESSKTTRKPRKSKVVSIDKIVENLKFQKEDGQLGLVSINPRDIVGAQELWVYNTKTRKIGKYIATDAQGLGVKSATILNFSSESTEKTLRKPKEQLKAFKAAGKVALRTFMADIATLDTKLKSRLNENHILLKVVK